MNGSFNGFAKPKPDKRNGSNIKSIQRGVATFSATDVTKTIPNNGVDLSRAIVIIEWTHTNTPGYCYYGGISGKLNSATELLLSRWATVSGTRSTIEVAWQVIEFNNVKSLQKGTLTTVYDGTAYSAVINSIDTTKSILFYSYTNNTGNTNFYGEHLEGYIANATTLNFNQIFNAKTIEWQVIEFN